MIINVKNQPQSSNTMPFVINKNQLKAGDAEPILRALLKLCFLRLFFLNSLNNICLSDVSNKNNCRNKLILAPHTIVKQ